MSTTFEKFRTRKLEDPRVRDAYNDARARRELIERLVSKRKALGLSQVEVARRMGVKQPTVSGFETEDSDPRLSTIQRYARALGARLCLAMETQDLDGSWTCSSITSKWGTKQGPRMSISEPEQTWSPGTGAIAISASFVRVAAGPQWQASSDQFGLAA